MTDTDPKMSRALFREIAVSRSEAEVLVSSVKWFHSVEIVDGLIAPGQIPVGEGYDAAGYINSLGFGPDMSGLRVLEIGTWDGPLAYEIKNRRADIVATDIQDPDKTGFNVLRQISGVHVPYTRCSVYELSRHFSSEFDVTLFFGVFYHLKHPLLAFEVIAQVMKLGGTLFTEGAGLGSYMEDLDRKPVGDPIDPFATKLEELDKRGVPLVLSYPGTFIGGENWFLPNRSALKGWLMNAGLDATDVFTVPSGAPGHVRVGARATKVRDTAYVEHSLRGEAGGYRSDLASAL